MSLSRITYFVCLAVFCVAACRGATARAESPVGKKAASEKQNAIDFVRDVQPIFKQTCLSCHGAEEQEGGLRLDLKQLALEGGDAGAAIVPGKPAESRLLALVEGRDEDLGRMPPEGEGAPLTAAQISILKRWIQAGAVWPDNVDGDAAQLEHWSFQPIVRPTPPVVKQSDWVRNGIDAFILAKLEQENVSPSPAAARTAQARRLYLDLLGLPPSPQEVAAFLNDTRPDAYERLVDRLLASPHYGERWGRHWLDLARYADSDGYEKDRQRPHAWRFRQWVLEAINQDLPFDEFSVQQLAGDLLPNADQETRVATGFHRNTLHNTEGGTDKEEDRVKKTVDRTNTTGAVWLGLTVGCAQCHSHKYDPLTQREYYSLYGFFNNMDEVDIAAPRPQDVRAYEQAQAAFDRQHAPLTAALNDYRAKELPEAQRKWAAGAASSTGWAPLVVTKVNSTHGATFEIGQDYSVLASGTNKVSDIYTIETSSPEKASLEKTPAASISAIRLEALTDKRLPKNGPGRVSHGNFVLRAFRAAVVEQNGQQRPVSFQTAKADFSQNDWAVANAIDPKTTTGWAIAPQMGKRHVAVFELAEPLVLAKGERLLVTLDQTYEGQSHNLGKFRLSVTSQALPVDLEGLPADIVAALSLGESDRTDAQRKRLQEHYAKIDAKLRQLQKAVDDHAKKKPRRDTVKAQTVSERKEVRETRVHIRGDFLNKGEQVKIGTPRWLPQVQLSGQQPARLQMARWLFSQENPLTARVAANRAWSHFFGRGITPTVDDFGMQGTPPTHPELLDWLAASLRSTWSMKQLHRLIVTSSTYRQGSAVREDLQQRDPENEWVARQVRRRVEAEVIRDLALAASGLLDPRLGGPGVRPRQPAEYSKLTYANSAKWATSPGGDAYRRGLYTFFQRTSPYPMLMTFDSPDSTETCTERSMSNTPLQALTLWNDGVFHECAQELGRRILRETASSAAAGPSGDAARIAYAFQLCFGRSPQPAEVAAVQELLAIQLEMLGSPESIANKSAEQIAGNGPLPNQADMASTAAWVVVARTLLNLDEFITRE